ncbi:MAG: pilus assembly FimT family protein [Elusimicrobiota bacterium]
MINFIKKNEGFTLTELLCAFAISIIILLTAGVIISRGMSSWIRGEKKINLDRDAHYAVLSMARIIREGSRVEVEDGEDTEVTVYYPGDHNPRKILSWDTTTDTLYVNDKDDNAVGNKTSIIGRISSLSFEKEDFETVVKIELTLEDEDDEDIQSSSKMITEYKNRIDY